MNLLSTAIMLHKICGLVYRRFLHTKGSCKKLASQAGQDLTHLAKAVKILASLLAISLAYLQDYESCKKGKKENDLTTSNDVAICV